MGACVGIDGVLAKAVARGDDRMQPQRVEAAGTAHANLLMAGLNVMSDAFCCYDSDDRLVHYNDAMLAMYAKIGEMIRPGVAFCDLLEAAISR